MALRRQARRAKHSHHNHKDHDYDGRAASAQPPGRHGGRLVVGGRGGRGGGVCVPRAALGPTRHTLPEAAHNWCSTPPKPSRRSRSAFHLTAVMTASPKGVRVRRGGLPVSASASLAPPCLAPPPPRTRLGWRVLGLALFLAMALVISVQYAAYQVRENSAGAMPAQAPRFVPRRSLAVLIGVHTRPEPARRHALRSTWVPDRQGLKLLEAEHGVAIRFVIGRSENSTLNVAVAAEARRFGDIMRVPTVENYYNLVYKTMAFFRAALDEFDADYIMKSDDDVYIRCAGGRVVCVDGDAGEGLQPSNPQPDIAH